MIVGPKYKICKRLGSGVFEKCQTQKFMLSEARSAKNAPRGRRRTLSEFGRQLLEKQRVRFTYGIGERQLARYVRVASDRKGSDSALDLLASLELRLDNVIYRMGLAPTRRMARQLVSHGHFTVDGKRTTVPSHRLSVGEVVAIREGSRGRAPFAGLAERLKDYRSPSWVSFNPETLTGSVTAMPSRENADVGLDLSGVLEFYSR